MSAFELQYPFTWFRSPLSGDVIQNISPDYSSVEIAGNVNIERRIVREVASFGDQLGTVLDVLSLLAKDLDPNDKAVQKLSKLVGAVDTIKKQEAESAEKRARDALQSLKSVDPETYAAIVAELAQETSE